MAVELWAVGLVMLGSVIGAFGPIYFKKASKRKITGIFSLILNHNLIIGVALYGLSTVVFIPALKGGDLSILYPLVSLGYIWVSLLSIYFFKEKMNKYKWLGIILIIAGTFFVGFGS